jgi:CheY-like chemotaxis protein
VRVVQRPAGDAPSEHPRAQSPLMPDCERLNLAGVRVLIVDDQSDARALIQRILGECECATAIASSASEAIGQLTENEFDIVISDVGMPGEDGHAFIRNWRKIESETGRKRVPAIALTAYVRAEDRRRSILAGFQAHLGKPVESGELLAQVASLAGRV